MKSGQAGLVRPDVEKWNMPDPFAQWTLNAALKKKTFCAPHKLQKVLVAELNWLPYPMRRVPLRLGTVLTATPDHEGR